MERFVGVDVRRYASECATSTPAALTGETTSHARVRFTSRMIRPWTFSAGEECPGERGPAHGERRVQVESSGEPDTCAGGVARASFRVAAVEIEQGVARAEPERAVEPGDRLATAARPRERPTDGIVPVDRRPSGTRAASEGNRLRRSDRVVGSIARPSRDRPGRRWQPGVGRSRRRVARWRRAASGRAARAARAGRRAGRRPARWASPRRAGRLPGWRRGDRRPQRRPEPARRVRSDNPGARAARPSCVAGRGRAGRAHARQLGELDMSPRRRLGLTRGRRERQLHGGEGASPVPDELAGVAMRAYEARPGRRRSSGRTRRTPRRTARAPRARLP